MNLVDTTTTTNDLYATLVVDDIHLDTVFDSTGSTIVIGNLHSNEVIIKTRTDKDNWELSQTLEPDEFDKYTNFGCKVKLSGDDQTLLVVSTNDVSENGIVYVYQKEHLYCEFSQRYFSTWVLIDKLEGITPTSGEQFGIDIDIDHKGHTIVVGTEHNLVYVYDRVHNEERYALNITLKPLSKYIPDISYGTKVAISGNGRRIMVGSPLDEIQYYEHNGSVFIYDRSVITDKWSLYQKLTPQTGGHDIRFGSSVDLSYDGKIVVIGAIQPTKHFYYIYKQLPELHQRNTNTTVVTYKFKLEDIIFNELEQELNVTHKGLYLNDDSSLLLVVNNHDSWIYNIRHKAVGLRLDEQLLGFTSDFDKVYYHVPFLK